MGEPLLGNGPLTGAYDPLGRVVSLQTRMAGPAGSAALELGAAIALDVDVAEPATVAALTVELPDGGVARLPSSLRRRLDALVGSERAGQVAALVADGCLRREALERRLSSASGAGSSEDVGSPEGADGEAGDDRVGPLHPHACGTGVNQALQRAALARAAAGRPGATRLVQAVGLLEAAAALAPLDPPGLPELRRSAAADASQGAELLLDVAARGRVVVPSQRAAHALTVVLRQAGTLIDGTAAPVAPTAAAGALARLADDLSLGVHTVPVPASSVVDGPPPPAAATCIPSSSSARAALPTRVRVDVRARSGALAEAAIGGRIRQPSEVEVRIDGWADRRHGLWARAFDAADDCLVGLAPFRRDGSGSSDAVARILVPPHRRHRLEVDVTDRPEMPRPSPTLALVERAIHEGALAARAERSGDITQARRRWASCSRSWQAAGDQRRAAQAWAHASARPDRSAGRDAALSGAVIGPLATDLVDGLCGRQLAPLGGGSPGA